MKATKFDSDFDDYEATKFDSGKPLFNFDDSKATKLDATNKVLRYLCRNQQWH